MFFISILLIQVQEVQKQAKIMIFPQTPPWILKFFVILMSTCYNKSNLKVKKSSEQFWIEMSISNGVLTPHCPDCPNSTKLRIHLVLPNFCWLAVITYNVLPDLNLNLLSSPRLGLLRDSSSTN